MASQLRNPQTVTLGTSDVQRKGRNDLRGRTTKGHMRWTGTKSLALNKQPLRGSSAAIASNLVAFESRLDEIPLACAGVSVWSVEAPLPDVFSRSTCGTGEVLTSKTLSPLTHHHQTLRKQVIKQPCLLGVRSS